MVAVGIDRLVVPDEKNKGPVSGKRTPAGTPRKREHGQTPSIV
jgi:hypothetical protein